MIKTLTACCALCQINDVNNKTTKKELVEQLNTLVIEKNSKNRLGTSNGEGQTSVFIIVSPGEDILENNLKSLKFKLANIFKRRMGYEKGDLKMYIKNL